MRSSTVAPRFAVVFAAGVFLAGCLEMDRTPAGSYSEVLIVSEEGADDIAARAMESCLTRTIDYYVDREQAFTVVHVRAADVPDVPAYKNVVVCGVADPGSSVGRYILSQLGSAVVGAGGANVVARENLPGQGRFMLVVTAATIDEVSGIIDARGPEIVETIEASCRGRLRRHLLRYEDEALTRQIRETYGFVVRVPTDYKLLSAGSDPPGIELLREAPARLLGVFWIDWDRPPALEDSSTLYRTRASYVWKRYDGDVMDSTRVSYKLSKLGAHPAVRMSGYWGNSRALAGGYYETFFVYDETARLLWCIDLLAFAPGLPKHPQLRELLALAETFEYD